MNFHVARAFEFFIDHVVHAAARIDERGGQYGERAFVVPFDVARRAEKLFRAFHRQRIEPAGKRSARTFRRVVVRAGEARDGIH